MFQPADGVMCCKTTAKIDADAATMAPSTSVRVGAVGRADAPDAPPSRLGRALTAINVSTYGWYYTW